MDPNNKTPKLQMCGYDSDLEILVKKIKVKKYVFKLYFSHFISIFIMFPMLASREILPFI